MEDLRALARGLIFGTFASPAPLAVAATVTPPSESPIETSVIWPTPITEGVPLGGDFQRAEPRRVVAVRTDDVPALPRGTVIVSTIPPATAPSTWKVDAIESVFSDHVRAVVVAYVPPVAT